MPERGTLKFGSAAFEVIATLPLAAPPVVGVNVTVNDVLCPVVNVNGSEIPLMLKPVPVAEAAEIVRLVPPLLVKVSDRLAFLPT